MGFMNGPNVEVLTLVAHPSRSDRISGMGYHSEALPRGTGASPKGGLVLSGGLPVAQIA